MNRQRHSVFPTPAYSIPCEANCSGWLAPNSVSPAHGPGPKEAWLAAVTDHHSKHPAHLGLGLLDPRLKRRKVRRVAGPRHDPQEVFPRGFRIEPFADAEPQNLGQVMIETRRRTQDFRRRLRQHLADDLFDFAAKVRRR